MRTTTRSAPRSFRDHVVRALRVGFAAGLFGGCAPPGADATRRDAAHDDASAISIPTTYVALEDALTGDKERARWRELQQRLAAAFDEVCGDTFCEGDWSNLEPLDLSCSASSKRGQVRECVWTFGASDERIDAESGAIAASIPIFACRFRPGGNATQLVDALHDDPLRAPLPGSDASIYDALSDCFDAPSGATQLDGALDGPYADASEGLATDAAVEAWYSMISGLRSEYDEAADSDPDAGAPRALRFRCSEDRDTGRLGTCAWSFAGGRALRRANGVHRVVEERHLCSFTPNATASELAAALVPDAGGAEPLNRVVPGLDVTLREILDECW